MELVKVREERLKKNEERIKSIKNIYEHYGKKAEPKVEEPKKYEKRYRSEKKMPETDNEDRRGQKKRIEGLKKAKQEHSDVEF